MPSIAAVEPLLNKWLFLYLMFKILISIIDIESVGFFSSRSFVFLPFLPCFFSDAVLLSPLHSCISFALRLEYAPSSGPSIHFRPSGSAHRIRRNHYYPSNPRSIDLSVDWMNSYFGYSISSPARSLLASSLSELGGCQIVPASIPPPC